MCLFVFESVHSCENKRIEMENKNEIIDTPTATICRMVVLPLPREMGRDLCDPDEAQSSSFHKALSLTLWRSTSNFGVECKILYL